MDTTNHKHAHKHENQRFMKEATIMMTDEQNRKCAVLPK